MTCDRWHVTHRGWWTLSQFWCPIPLLRSTSYGCQGGGFVPCTVIYKMYFHIILVFQILDRWLKNVFSNSLKRSRHLQWENNALSGISEPTRGPTSQLLMLVFLGSQKKIPIRIAATKTYHQSFPPLTSSCARLSGSPTTSGRRWGARPSTPSSTSASPTVSSTCSCPCCSSPSSTSPSTRSVRPSPFARSPSPVAGYQMATTIFLHACRKLMNKTFLKLFGWNCQK